MLKDSKSIFIFVLTLLSCFGLLLLQFQILFSGIFFAILTLFIDCDLSLHLYTYFGKRKEDLKSKVIWITGASTGIGKSIAVELSNCNVKLILSARSEDKLKTVKSACLENGVLSENDILVLPFDMTDFEKHKWAFESVIEKFQRIDILLSNAGRSQRASWEKIDTAVDKAMFELNVFSLLNLARIVTCHFFENGSGHHVVMSSVAGKFGVPFSGSYSGSKHAIQGYFEGLRAEFACKSSISVTMLCPGPVESNIMQNILGENVNEAIHEERRGKMMSSERCAELSVIAIANKVSEAWICSHPVLLLIYANQYLPLYFKWFMNNFDFGKISMKVRDGK